MDKKRNRGEIIEVVLLVLGLFAFTAYIGTQVTPGEVTTETGERSGGSFFSDLFSPAFSISPIESSGYSSGSGSNSSSRSSRIRLGTGNAPYAYEPYREYITIDNSTDEPINLTGWRLKNGKDTRPYDQGGTNLRYFPSDEAFIGQGARHISPAGGNVYQNIILEPGEGAIITTGRMGASNPYPIISFKENICSGYLAEETNYNFEPSLSQDCPDPSQERGVEGLDPRCREYIDGMSSCHTPEYNAKYNDGEVCRNCVDGTPLSNACVAFIKSHNNYASCIYNHSLDPDFSLDTWRIFLNHGWELWAEKYETISVFDQFSRLIDYVTY